MTRSYMATLGKKGKTTAGTKTANSLRTASPTSQALTQEEYEDKASSVIIDAFGSTIDKATLQNMLKYAKRSDVKASTLPVNPSILTSRFSLAKENGTRTQPMR